MAGFKAETESGVRGAFSNVGKIVGGAFAALGAFEVGKHLAESAASHQAAFAVLDRTIKNAGATVQGFGASLDSVLAKEGRLKGFSDEQLAAGLTRLVSVTHNTRKAFDDLRLAEDLSRATHKDLTVSALALSRAEQGSTQTLSRFGIKVPEVTIAVDRLKHAHDEAVASGAKFTGQAGLEYKALLAQAQASDKAATRQEALTLVQKRFGGVATVFARSAAGEFARFGESVHQLEISLGNALLPALTHVAGGLASYVGNLSQSRGLQNAVRSGAHDLAAAFGVVRSIAETVGPPLLTIAKGAREVAHALGAAPILAAIGTYKGLILVLGKAAALEKSYAAAVALGKAAKVADVASTDAQLGVFGRLNASLQATRVTRLSDAEAARLHTTAVTESATASTALTAAITRTTPALAEQGAAFTAAAEAANLDAAAGIRLTTVYGPLGGILATVSAEADGAAASFAALGASEAGIGSAGVALAAIGPEATAAAGGLDVLAASEIAVGTAGAGAAVGGLAAFASGIGRLALGAVGGPVGIAVLGLAALGGGIAYLVTRESDAERETKRLGKAIGDFGTAAASQKSAVQSLADAKVGLESDRAAVATARLTLETARHTLASSSAARGSFAYQQQVAAVAQALAGYHSALQQTKDDLSRVADAQGQTKVTAAAATAAFGRVEATSKQLTAALTNQYLVYDTAGKFGSRIVNQTATLANTQKHAADITGQFAARIETLIPALQQQSPLLAHNAQLLVEYVKQVGHVPSEKVTKIILSTPNLDATLKTVDAKLKSLDPNAYADGQAIGVSFGHGILAGIKGFANPFNAQLNSLTAKGVELSKKTQEQISKTLQSGIFSPAQVAKRFGVSVEAVKQVEKDTQAAADAAKGAAVARLNKPLNLPDIQAIIPFRIKLEEASASTDAARRKALIDEIGFLNGELQKNLTKSTRQNVVLERASLQAQVDQLDAAAKAASLTTAGTITSSQKAVETSVLSAKKNLDHIGQLLSDSVAKFLKKTGGSIGSVGDAGSPVSAAYKKLFGLLKSGASDPEIARAAAELNNFTTTQTKTTGNLKDQIRQQIGTIIDEFNRGKISAKKANAELAAALRLDHITPAQAGRITGLRGEIAAFHEQAAAIAAVPARFRAAGASTSEIRIIRPLEVMRHENAQAAARAARQRDRIARASERSAKASEKTAVAAAKTAAALAAVKKASQTPGHASAAAKKIAKTGVQP